MLTKSPRLLRFTSTESLRSQINLVDDFGLISNELDAFKPHSGHRASKNVNSVKIADFWGKEHTKNMIIKAKLTNAAQNLKFEYWKEDRKGRNLRNLPSLPHKLENLKCLADGSKSVEKKLVRVASPSFPAVKDVTNTMRLEAINGIIQSCVNCEGQKVVIKRVFENEKKKKRLTRIQKINIENQIWMIDHKF